MRTTTTLLAFLIIIFIPLLPASVDWPPVIPAELALKQPRIDKDADAEALLWDVRMADEVGINEERSIRNHYLRIKIFTDRGRDKYSTVDINFDNHVRVSDIAGRTIKPNGEMVELKKDAIYERVLVKAGGVKVKVKSFAMPAVETGCIIEYRWKETHDQLTHNSRLQFQRDIPVHMVKYHVKPTADLERYGMKVIAFHMNNPSFTKEKDGYNSTVVTDMPAFKEEPDMPAEADVRPWALLFYSQEDKIDPTHYWEKLGKEVYADYKSQIKINDEMRSAAAETVQGANTPEEKLTKLLEMVRKQFKNLTFDVAVTSQEREKAKSNKNTSDTWKQKAGTSRELSLLYVALATSLDFDARMTRSGDQTYGSFDKSVANRYFLPTYNVAVKVGDKWMFCDPASLFLPFGMLRWEEEGQAVLISDPKQPVFSQTTMSGPEASLTARTAKFRLSEEGTLEGDVQIVYTGHTAVSRKFDFQEESAAEREESVKQTVKSRFADAEVSDIKLEGASDPNKPIAVTYHVKIAGYAQRTGRRLFLKSSYFERDFSVRFPGSERKFMVKFPYGWSERDRITYELPDGFSLEKPEAPGKFKIGELGDYDVRMTISKDQKTLAYEREFYFGKGGILLFPVQGYSQLKKVFDIVQEHDDHLLTLRQGELASK